MPSLKSVFVSLYSAFLVAATVFGITQILGAELSLGWLGAVLTTAPFLLFLTWLTATQKKARTSRRLPSIIAFAVVGATLALWSWSLGASNAAPVIVAITGLVSFFVYVFWYSNLGPRCSGEIAIGRPLPRFDLQRLDGAAFNSHDWNGRASVLIFYRGNWCPLCMAQIKEVAALYQDIAALGARVALISPQPHVNTAKLAQRHEVAFEYHVDSNNNAACALGINHPGGLPFGMQALGYQSDTVLPTVIITDRSGVVRWAHETDNYRLRPEPELFLDVLRRQTA